MPPAKWHKFQSADMDQASFSSDSPQEDTLKEHLQSAIDSILNLQQVPGAGHTVHPCSDPRPTHPPVSKVSWSTRTLNR